MILINQIKIIKMKTYKITFISLDGNKNSVFVDALSSTRAISKFEDEYQFDEIIDCEPKDYRKN